MKDLGIQIRFSPTSTFDRDGEEGKEMDKEEKLHYSMHEQERKVLHLYGIRERRATKNRSKTSNEEEIFMGIISLHGILKKRNQRTVARERKSQQLNWTYDSTP